MSIFLLFVVWGGSSYDALAQEALHRPVVKVECDCKLAKSRHHLQKQVNLKKFFGFWYHDIFHHEEEAIASKFVAHADSERDRCLEHAGDAGVTLSRNSKGRPVCHCIKYLSMRFQRRSYFSYESSRWCCTGDCPGP